jgi:UDP-N-acetyl-D-mannosaminuronate dehydrogenase
MRDNDACWTTNTLNTQQLTTPSIVQVSSLETAEIVKLVDNTYRDVQFAFANEVARRLDKSGVFAALPKIGQMP